MASTTTTTLLLLFSTVIVTTTTARPCKTIFFITSSSHPHNNNNNNNNIPPPLTLFVTQIRDLDQPIKSLSSSSDVLASEPYVTTSSTLKASIRGRTMDIMSIVGAVIFGIGCGAITAATMYLFWSLFAPRRFEFCSDSESGDEEEDHERVDEDNDGYFGVPVVAKAVPPSADEVDRIAGMK